MLASMLPDTGHALRCRLTGQQGARRPASIATARVTRQTLEKVDVTHRQEASGPVLPGSRDFGRPIHDSSFSMGKMALAIASVMTLNELQAFVGVRPHCRADGVLSGGMPRSAG